jgi:hypothetical protein
MVMMRSTTHRKPTAHAATKAGGGGRSPSPEGALEVGEADEEGEGRADQDKRHHDAVGELGALGLALGGPAAAEAPAVGAADRRVDARVAVSFREGTLG